jgi:hypothetical protein
MSCCCQAQPAAPTQPRRRVGLLGWLVQIALLYVLLVFGGGTLVKVPHPVAQEVGRLMQMVSFVEPTIRWADRQGYAGLGNGLRVLAAGAPVERLG